MDFTTIGTLHSYVQQKNMKFAAEYKKKTGQSVVTSSGNLTLDLKAANNTSLVEKMIKAQKKGSDYSKYRTATIKQKLMNGKKLSNEEMGYLKRNEPNLYKKAKKAEEAREDLKADLKKAKTKSEARQAVTRALIKASAEATAELNAAKGAAGGGSGGSGAISSSGYEASQNIGGPNAEAIFGGNDVNGNGNEEPSMIRLNEQINAQSTEGDVNVEEANQEGAILKDINNEINIAKEISTEAAKAESANSPESINNKPEHSNLNTPNNPNKIDNNEGDASSDILEKFIMVVRAIEDEWMNFAKSDEYKELAEDEIEEAKIELATGKHKRKKKFIIDKPNQQVMDIVSIYRNAMMYSSPLPNDTE